MSSATLAVELRDIIENPPGDLSVEDCLYMVRKKLFECNLNKVEDLDLSNVGQRSLRGKVWKILLGTSCNMDRYYELLGTITTHGQEIQAELDQIERDVNRTFKSSNFVNVDKLSQLTRVLSAYHMEFRNEKYIQGMNVIAGTLLCVMTEVEAFFCYKELMQNYFPIYHSRAVEQKNCGMEGSNYGVALVIIILEKLDPELFRHLKINSNGMQKFTQLAHIIFSFGGSTPGLRGFLRLWDLMMIFGFHLNPIICTIRILKERSALLDDRNPFSLLDVKHKFGAEGNLDKSVGGITKSLMAIIFRLMDDKKLYYIIENHTHSFEVKPLLLEYPTAALFLNQVGIK